MDLTGPNQGNCIDCGAVIYHPTGRGRQRKRCEPCVKKRKAEYAAKRHRQLAAEGKCANCGKSKSGAGLYCRSCARRRAVIAEKRKQQRIASGKCIACGKNKAGKGLMCCSCASRYATRQLKLYAQRRAEGRCGKCGGVPQEGRAYCSECLQYARDSKAALKV